jgi:DNA-binding XRE family transcriptional regulator
MSDPGRSLVNAFQLPVESPTPEEVRAARIQADLTQAEAAACAGLANRPRWAEYEAGKFKMEPTRWAMFLLITGQYPGWYLAKIRA